MDNTLFRKIEDFLSNDENVIFRGGPTECDMIAIAEKELNVNFDKDYIEFLKLFGGSFVGLPIYGFKNSEMLSDQTVVDLTKEFRENYAYDNRCPEIQNSYVISVEGNGDPIMINSDGEVLIYNHDDDTLEQIAPSFERLIEDNLS
ncbi:SMI1/KNR4 family protein [Pedobacter sp. WC2501]|uniref:SMI1/KNR4 family protein n=1 Tax=Pedobacter sp. WC2501 TaxID=3461400 RepID=UPI0040459E95